MRYVYLILITFIFTACGHQKLHFVRTNSTKQKIIEIIDTPSSSKTKSEIVSARKTLNEFQESENSVDPKIVNVEESDHLNNPEIVTDTKEVDTYLTLNPKDSSEVSLLTKDEIIPEALRAEKLGTWSLTLSLLIYAFAICLFFALLASLYSEAQVIALVLAFVSLILGLAALIGSFILGIMSLRKPYNTKKGRKSAIAGIVISSIITAAILFSLVMSFL